MTVDAVGGQHFERGLLRRVGEGVGVLAQEERAVDALRRGGIRDGLGDGQDVVLVEGAVGGRAAVAGGAELHALSRYRRDLDGVGSTGLAVLRRR